MLKTVIYTNVKSFCKCSFKTGTDQFNHLTMTSAYKSSGYMYKTTISYIKILWNFLYNVIITQGIDRLTISSHANLIKKSIG